MNVIGERLAILSSTDPSKEGRSGIVMLDTARTLVLNSDGRTLRVEKKGNVFQLCDSKKVVAEAELAGRLEDRWGLRSK